MSTPTMPSVTLPPWMSYTLADYIRALPPEVKRMKRLAAAQVLRVGRRKDGRELSDVAVAYRVGGLLPSEVAAIRAEIEEKGVLDEELAVAERPPRREE